MNGVLDKNKDLKAITPSEIRSETEIFGRSDVTYYELKDKNHKILKYFYRDYKNLYEPVVLDIMPDIGSYDDFLNLHPVMFYYDFANRLIMVVRDDLIPPSVCEPIIYLYSPQKQNIFVSVKSKISNSFPNIANGISINADENSCLRDQNNNFYPYLF